jgi:hypothetical protein
VTPDDFLDAMEFFGEPRMVESTAMTVVMAAYHAEIAPYGPDVLKLAAETMIRVRKHRNFPLPEECRRACVDAQNELAAKRLASAPRKELADPWSPARIHLADSLMRSEQGALAAHEGWIITLHDWVRKHGRLPGDFERDRVRRAGLAFEARCRARSVEMEKPQNIGALRIMAPITRAFEAKRKRLTAIAMAEDA